MHEMEYCRMRGKRAGARFCGSPTELQEVIGTVLQLLSHQPRIWPPSLVDGNVQR
jgi:hypothetical protein